MLTRGLLKLHSLIMGAAQAALELRRSLHVRADRLLMTSFMPAAFAVREPCWNQFAWSWSTTHGPVEPLRSSPTMSDCTSTTATAGPDSRRVRANEPVDQALVSRQLAELKTASACSPVLNALIEHLDLRPRSFRVSSCVCQLAVRLGDLGLKGGSRPQDRPRRRIRRACAGRRCSPSPSARRPRSRNDPN
jgi:hypothetical protein